MKKILYSDYLFHYSIRNLNASFAKILSNEYIVYYCTNEDYLHSDKIHMIYDATFLQTKGKFNIALRIIQNAIKLKNIAEKLQPDYIIIGAYETRTINIILNFFRPSAPLILIENNNIDQLVNPTYLRLYKKAMNSVYHIALEDYIEDYMVSKIGVLRDHVFTIKHPYYEINSSANKGTDSNTGKYNIIALSDSNDEEFVRLFVENYESGVNKNVHIYIKSKTISFKSRYLTVGSEYLSDQLYNRMFNEADAVLLPFPKSYKYRISGNLIDAISNGKLVIATPFAFAMHIQKKFPSLVRIINSPSELLTTYMLDSPDSVEFNRDISSFKAERNEQSIINAFNQMFNSIDLGR